MATLTRSIALSTAATREPIGVEDAKAHPAVRVAGNHDDGVIQALIVAARHQVETDSRRSLLSQTWVEKFDQWPPNPIELSRLPLVSVTSITYLDTNGDSQTWSSSEYEVDAPRGVVWLGYLVSPPDIRATQNAVTITYVAGYGSDPIDVPQAAKDAIYLKVGSLYESRGFDDNEQRAYDSLLATFAKQSYP